VKGETSGRSLERKATGRMVVDRSTELPIGQKKEKFGGISG